MIFFLRFVAFVAAALCTPFLIAAQTGFEPASSSKRFALVADTSLLIAETDLAALAGDIFGGRSTLTIETEPSHGSLVFEESRGPAWRYTPDPDFFGRDGFTYKAGNQSYQAWIHVTPSKSPIAGRWPTEHCYPGPQGDGDVCNTHWRPGHGSELGWYDAVAETFNLCDWQLNQLIECVALDVPGSDDFQTWIPLTLDREGDGWHELALHDPLTAKMLVFEIRPSLEGNRPGSLVTVEEWRLGEPGDLPVAGNWAGDEVSELGVYRFDDQNSEIYGQLWLESSTGDLLISDLGNTIARPWPMAGNWLEEAEDQIGIFDLEQRILWFKAVVGGAVKSQVAGSAASSMPLAVRVANGRSEVVLAVFDPVNSNGTFYILRIRNDEDPLPLEVRVDPSGGPILPPSE